MSGAGGLVLLAPRGAVAAPILVLGAQPPVVNPATGTGEVGNWNRCLLGFCPGPYVARVPSGWWFVMMGVVALATWRVRRRRATSPSAGS